MKAKKKLRKFKMSKGEKQRMRLLLFYTISPIIIISFIIFYSSTDKEQKLTEQQRYQESLIPKEFIPIYKAAEQEYGVPWHLLAAHHRVETIFSTMDPMLSPVGAEGHMQFMPCTFVGWAHPTCEGLGAGNIPEDEKVNPDIIEKYNGFGVDANGDGIADPWDIEDAIFSAAHFLAYHGAAKGELEEAIYAYNHSEQYVEDVLSFLNLYISAFEENSEETTSIQK